MITWKTQSNAARRGANGQARKCYLFLPEVTGGII